MSIPHTKIANGDIKKGPAHKEQGLSTYKKIPLLRR